jgi:hypothetical protein
MRDKTIHYPDRRAKEGQRGGSSYPPMDLTGTATATGSPAAGLLEKDNAHPCDSAFLAERGCLSRAEPMRHPAPKLSGGTYSKGDRQDAAAGRFDPEKVTRRTRLGCVQRILHVSAGAQLNLHPGVEPPLFIGVLILPYTERAITFCLLKILI